MRISTHFPFTPTNTSLLILICVILRMRCWVYTDQITLTNLLCLSVRVHLIAGAVVCAVRVITLLSHRRVTFVEGKKNQLHGLEMIFKGKLI